MLAIIHNETATPENVRDVERKATLAMAATTETVCIAATSDESLIYIGTVNEIRQATFGESLTPVRSYQSMPSEIVVSLN